MYKAATGTVDFSSLTNALLSVVLIVMPLTWGIKAYMSIKEKQRNYQVPGRARPRMAWHGMHGHHTRQGRAALRARRDANDMGCGVGLPCPRSPLRGPARQAASNAGREGRAGHACAAC